MSERASGVMITSCQRPVRSNTMAEAAGETCSRRLRRHVGLEIERAIEQENLASQARHQTRCGQAALGDAGDAVGHIELDLRQIKRRAPAFPVQGGGEGALLDAANGIVRDRCRRVRRP